APPGRDGQSEGSSGGGAGDGERRRSRGRLSFSGAGLPSRTPVKRVATLVERELGRDAADGQPLSSVIVLQSLRAPPAPGKKLGSDAFLSPVRRSLRNNPGAAFAAPSTRSAASSEPATEAAQGAQSGGPKSGRRRITLSAQPDNMDQTRMETMLEETN